MRDGLIDRKVLLKQLETMALNAPDSKRTTFAKVISSVEIQSPADYEIVKHGFWDDSFDGKSRTSSNPAGMDYTSIWET